MIFSISKQKKEVPVAEKPYLIVLNEAGKKPSTLIGQICKHPTTGNV
jgi:hypothetical protein